MTSSHPSPAAAPSMVKVPLASSGRSSADRRRPVACAARRAGANEEVDVDAGDRRTAVVDDRSDDARAAAQAQHEGRRIGRLRRDDVQREARRVALGARLDAEDRAAAQRLAARRPGSLRVREGAARLVPGHLVPVAAPLACGELRLDEADAELLERRAALRVDDGAGEPAAALHDDDEVVAVEREVVARRRLETGRIGLDGQRLLRHAVQLEAALVVGARVDVVLGDVVAREDRRARDRLAARVLHAAGQRVAGVEVQFDAVEPRRIGGDGDRLLDRRPARELRPRLLRAALHVRSR